MDIQDPRDVWALFSKHTDDFPPPDGTIFDPDLTPEQMNQQVAAIIRYITDLQADLSTKEGTMNPLYVAHYKQVYKLQMYMYMAVLDPSRLTAPPAAAPAPAPAAVAGPSGIKARLPDKFTGLLDKIDLFLDGMAAYYTVTNTPVDKKAGILQLNLSDTVITTLTHTNTHIANFWSDYDTIVNAMKRTYAQPNKKAAAQKNLKALRMYGYKLHAHFNKYITLCGESGYNPDNQEHKSQYHEQLNNKSTSGGLRVQTMHLLYDENVSLQAMYAFADNILQAEHGVNYVQKTCPQDRDEHRRVTAGTSRVVDKKNDGWQPAKTGKRKTGGNGNGGGYNKPQPSPKRNKTPLKKQNNRSDNNTEEEVCKCERCRHLGHTRDTCNAKNTVDGEPLPIETAAKYLSGEWKGRKEYPQKQHKNNKKAGRGNNNNEVDTSNINVLSTVPPVMSTNSDLYKKILLAHKQPASIPSADALLKAAAIKAVAEAKAGGTEDGAAGGTDMDVDVPVDTAGEEQRDVLSSHPIDSCKSTKNK